MFHVKHSNHIAVRLLSLVAAGALAISAAGCAPSKPEVTASADDVTPAVVVQAADNLFTPETVTIKVGEAVKWQFAGSAEHDVVADDGSFVSKLQRSGSFTHVFTKAGTYKYKCSVHPEMRGTIIVTE